MKAGGARLASVDMVAQEIIDAVECGQAVAYVPGKWFLVMMIIRHLPQLMFDKLNI
jgi:decaprenylphospho-beta-D-erythro-pentofuranosid-2-ulose 2-reductase